MVISRRACGSGGRWSGRRRARFITGLDLLFNSGRRPCAVPGAVPCVVPGAVREGIWLPGGAMPGGGVDCADTITQTDWLLILHFAWVLRPYGKDCPLE